MHRPSVIRPLLRRLRFVTPMLLALGLLVLLRTPGDTMLLRIAGMGRLRLAHTVVSVAWMTERFLALLTTDLRRTMDGVRARSAALSFPRRVLLGSRFAASYLLRAVSRSEHLADAMTARGFDGRIPALPGARWDVRDTFAASGSIVVILLAVFA